MTYEWLLAFVHMSKKYTLPKIRYLKVETTILEVKNEIYSNFHPSEMLFELVPRDVTEITNIICIFQKLFETVGIGIFRRNRNY